MSGVKCHKGFTIIEIIVVTAIFTALVSLGLVVSFQYYKSFSLRTERDRVVILLTQARAQSMANINQSAHGVHLLPGQYVVFQGTQYQSIDPLNFSVPADGSVRSTSSSDIVFDQLSGNGVHTGTITLGSGALTNVITINSEGSILW